MSLTKEHFDKKAKKSQENRAIGGKNVTVDLRKTIAVRFTKDVGFIKAGQVQNLSETAFEIYDNLKAVEKVN